MILAWISFQAALGLERARCDFRFGKSGVSRVVYFSEVVVRQPLGTTTDFVGIARLIAVIDIGWQWLLPLEGGGGPICLAVSARAAGVCTP